MSDTGGASLNGSTHLAAYNVVAVYEEPRQARVAMTALERHGVEANDIELFGPGLRLAEMPVTNDEQRAFDMDAVGNLARRGAIGVVIGALIGALLGFGIGALLGGAWFGWLIGGVVVGGPLGFLYAGYSGLTVNEHWQDTFEAIGEICVAVHSANEREMRTAIATLRRTPAIRLCTCGLDGELHDVA